MTELAIINNPECHVPAAAAETLVQFDTSILAGQLAPSSIQQYKIDFGRYLEWCDDFADAIKPSMLARFRQHLFEHGYTNASGEAKPYSVNRINRMLASVRRIMAEAAQQGFISQSVADDFKAIKGLTVKANKDRRKANSRTRITKEQIIEVCNQPDRETPAGMMHYALLLTLRYSGLRVSEIVNLKFDDIQWVVNDEGKGGWCASVLGKNMTEAECREIGSLAYDAIAQWFKYRANVLGVDSDYIFTSFSGRGSRNPSDKAMSRTGAWKLVRRYAKAAGLANIKPHDFRRYVGTQLAKKDLRIAQKQLGHKRIETTVQNYVLDDVAIGNVDDL